MAFNSQHLLDSGPHACDHVTLLQSHHALGTTSIRFSRADRIRATGGGTGCEAIVTRSSDNTYLPEDYLADLETFSGLARARYVEGRWVGSEGLVYDRWDHQVHVRHREGPWARVLVGQDEGYTNPACMLMVCEDEDGRVHVADEWYEARRLESEVVERAKRRQQRPGA